MNLTPLIKEIKILCEQRKKQTPTHSASISFYVKMDPIWWTNALGFSYRELVKAEDMRLAAAFQLKCKHYKMTRFDDDEPQYLSLATIPTYIPVITPFGVPYEHDFQSGGYHVPPVVKNEHDLQRLKPPLFTQKDMANADRKKREMEQEVGGLIPVTASYPREIGWFGPFSLACGLCGMNNMLEWMITDPALVHHVMRFITESTLGYYRQKAAATGKDAKNLSFSFAEDEVSDTLFSSAQYREFILPYHRELAETATSVYFHSCANINNFIEDIVTLPNLARLHFSPSTGLAKIDLVPKDIVIEAHLDPVRDIEQADDRTLADKVRDIIRRCRGHKLDLRISSIMSCSPENLEERNKLIQKMLNLNGGV